ncbi:hypothetical protein AAG906_003546 [Vitis piasezkii]
MLGVRSVGCPFRWKRVAVGLGSSAGSADASSVAVNEIFGRKLGADDLVLAGLTRGRKFGIVESKRAPLIPVMGEVKKAAIQAGPTAVSVTDDEEKGREIGELMVEAFLVERKLQAVAIVNQIDRVGARLMSSSLRWKDN